MTYRFLLGGVLLALTIAMPGSTRSFAAPAAQGASAISDAVAGVALIDQVAERRGGNARAGRGRDGNRGEANRGEANRANVNRGEANRANVNRGEANRANVNRTNVNRTVVNQNVKKAPHTGGQVATQPAQVVKKDGKKKKDNTQQQ